MKLKGVARNRIRTQQGVQVADGGGNFMSTALDTITGVLQQNKVAKDEKNLKNLNAEVKATGEWLKELEKMPSTEKRKQAKDFYAREIENNRDLKGGIRGINKVLDVRRLDAQRDDIYKFAMEQGENPEDAMNKIIRSEEELMEILERDTTYTTEEKEQMLKEYTEIGNSKSSIYQGVWNRIEGNFTKEELFNTVGIIKEHSSLFDITETTEMTKVLVEASIENGTISNSEGSTIMATIGDTNLNSVLEAIRDSDQSDAEKEVAYSMIIGAIEERTPDFFQNMGYEPFSYGTASTQFNNFKSKLGNEVAVGRQELAKLKKDKREDYAKYWNERGNEFNGDYRTTREFTYDYIKENLPQEYLTLYEGNPTQALEMMYVENSMPDFSYFTMADKEAIGSVLNDPNTPREKYFGVQLGLQNKILGKVPYDSIEYEIFNQEMFEQGGYSPELMTAMDNGKDPNSVNVGEKIQSGKFLNEGAFGRLDALTLIEAVQSSDFTNKEILGYFDAMKLLGDESGFNRMSERFSTEFSRLLSYHINRRTSTMEDQTIIDKVLNRTKPTEALLSGGLPTEVFETIIASDEFGEDVKTLIGSYTDGKSVLMDEVTNQPVVANRDDITQEELNIAREQDGKGKIYFKDGDKFKEANEDQKANMTFNPYNSSYGYYLQGGDAYEKLDSGEYILLNRSIDSDFGIVRSEGSGGVPSYKEFISSTIEKIGEGVNGFFKNNNENDAVEEGVTEKNAEFYGSISRLTGGNSGINTTGEGQRKYTGEAVQKTQETPMLKGDTKDSFVDFAQVRADAMEQKAKESKINKVEVEAEVEEEKEYKPPRGEEHTANVQFNRIYAENRSSEGYHENRYKSKEKGTDTIGIGHKMSSAEHKGGYVILDGEKRMLDTPLTNKEIDKLFRQDYQKAMNRLTTKLESKGVNYDELTPQFQEVAFRIAFNSGNIFNGMIEGMKENDMEKFNKTLIGSTRFTDQDTGKSYLSSGLARDRAKSYNMVNEKKIDHVIYTKEGEKTVFIYYDNKGNEMYKFERTTPLKTGKGGNRYNKKYNIN